jgi:hypothetical protein
LPAQFYAECAQLQVSGGGSLAPTASELVTFPGGYSNTDPGLTIDIYSNAAQTETTYPIPGPPLYGSTGSSSSSPGNPSSTSSHTTTTSSHTTTSPTSTPTGPTVPEYGQCGGIGWTGGTVCASPYTCKVSNPYYSQCL